MVILAVDYGRARTGLAVSDKNERLASPIGTVTESDSTALAQKIFAEVQKHKAELIVMGLPKNMDGSEGESAKNIRNFAETLKAVTGLEIVLRDERCTTITAHGYLNETNTRGKKRKAVVDSVAAVIILEDYLRYRRNII